MQRSWKWMLQITQQHKNARQMKNQKDTQLQMQESLGKKTRLLGSDFI